MKTFCLILGTYAAIGAALSVRQLTINRNRYAVTLVVYQLIIVAGFLAIGAGLLPSASINGIVGLGFIVTLSFYEERPSRMDYNLCLRAAQGMLPDTVGTPAAGEALMGRREELLAFGRFLGERWLAVNYTWTEEGLKLRLPKMGQLLGTWRDFP